MFDGWEDVNGESVVNVMIRVSSSLQVSTATYFLDIVYTKSQKVDAYKYVEIIEQVMREYKGSIFTAFTGINGVVSDSARACVKAKSLLAEKYPSLVMIQDQAHATDLLMSDLGKLPWFKIVLSAVSGVAQAVRNNRKLLSRFKDLIKVYNAKVKGKQPAEDVWSFLTFQEMDEFHPSLSPNEEPSETQGVSSMDAQRMAFPERHQQTRSAIPPIRPTAVTLKRTVKTRFASAETMLEGSLRSCGVLRWLIRDPGFTRLYDSSRSAAIMEKREREFVEVIQDATFYEHVREVHNILRVLRRYLRVWDAEDSQISEVVPATILLEYTLQRIPETEFLSADRKSEVLSALQRRCIGATTASGGTMQIRILQDVHYAAWLLDPDLCPSEIESFIPAFRRHVSLYIKSVKEM